MIECFFFLNFLINKRFVITEARLHRLILSAGLKPRFTAFCPDVIIVITVIVKIPFQFLLCINLDS